MRDRLSEGAPLYGTMLSEVFFPNITYMYKNCGYDFFIIDCEHGPFDYSQVSALVNTARLAGLSAIVRIPELRRECVIKFLDMGASGLLLPMVRSVQEVRDFTSLALYPPNGRRGISINRAHSRYNPGRLEDYMPSANERVILLAQIETIPALEQAGEIASVDGLSGLIIGPSDLSAELALTGQSDRETLYGAMSCVKKSCADSEVSCGIITSERPLLSHAKALGFNILCFDSELRVLSEGIRRGIEEVRGV